jgi:hypothetical protein
MMGGQWDLMGAIMAFWRFARVSALYAKRQNFAQNDRMTVVFRLVPIKSQIASMAAHGEPIEKPEFGF